jgi:hypothetical protein
MYHDDVFRQIRKQHEEMTAPFRRAMEQHEAVFATLKKAMEPYESLARQAQAAIESFAGPALDYEKMFGAGSITKNLEAMLPRAPFEPIGLPDSLNWNEALREAEQKRLQEDSERAREAMELQDRMMRDMAESRERALDRIADKVVEKLKPTFPVKKKPRIGFGNPED